MLLTEIYFFAHVQKYIYASGAKCSVFAFSNLFDFSSCLGLEFVCWPGRVHRVLLKCGNQNSTQIRFAERMVFIYGSYTVSRGITVSDNLKGHHWTHSQGKDLLSCEGFTK